MSSTNQVTGFRLFQVAALVLALAVCSIGVVKADTLQVIADPDKFAAENAASVSKLEIQTAVRQITGSIGRSDAESAIGGALGYFQGKTAAPPDKVLDQRFGNSMRQVVYMIAFAESDFLYLRYNFKRNSKGWVLVHFDLESESSQMFPEGFVFGP